MLVAPRVPAHLLAVPQVQASAAEIGERLGQALAGWPLPLLAVQSHFSLLGGVVPPGAWGEAPAAFHAAHRDAGDGPGGLLPARHDLLRLPARPGPRRVHLPV